MQTSDGQDGDDGALGIRIMKISRVLRLRFDRRAAGVGLTSAQWRTIAAVRRFPGATQREIAALLEVGEVTVGRSIDKLVEAGWLERRADAADRRAYRIHLTDAIGPVTGELTRLGHEEEAIALAGFSEGEHRALLAMLERIATNLGGEIGPADVGCDPRG